MSLEEDLVEREASVHRREGRLPIDKGQLAPKIFFSILCKYDRPHSPTNI